MIRCRSCLSSVLNCMVSAGIGRVLHKSKVGRHNSIASLLRQVLPPKRPSAWPKNAKDASFGGVKFKYYSIPPSLSRFEKGEADVALQTMGFVRKRKALRIGPDAHRCAPECAVPGNRATGREA